MAGDAERESGLETPLHATSADIDAVYNDETPLMTTSRSLGGGLDALSEFGKASRRSIMGASLLLPGSRWESGLHVFFLLSITSVYMAVGPALILVNKRILVDLHFPYPIAVSTLGQVASWAFGFAVFRVLRLQELTMDGKMTWRFYIMNMGVVGVSTAAALTLGQMAYLFLSVSFAQILKNLTPVLTSFLLAACGIESLSPVVWSSVILICAGSAVAAAGEVDFHLLGASVSIMSCACEALRTVITQRIVVNCKVPALEGLYLNAPITAAWMGLAFVVIELPMLLNAEHSALRQTAQAGAANATAHMIPLLANRTVALDDALPPVPPGVAAGAMRPSAVIVRHIWLFLWASTLGVAVNLASILMIKYTGSVTLKLLGTARNAGLVLYAIVVCGDATSVTQVAGYTASTLFFLVYIYAKSNNL